MAGWGFCGLLSEVAFLSPPWFFHWWSSDKSLYLQFTHPLLWFWKLRIMGHPWPLHCPYETSMACVRNPSQKVVSQRTPVSFFFWELIPLQQILAVIDWDPRTKVWVWCILQSSISSLPASSFSSLHSLPPPSLLSSYRVLTKLLSFLELHLSNFCISTLCSTGLAHLGQLGCFLLQWVIESWRILI